MIIATRRLYNFDACKCQIINVVDVPTDLRATTAEYKIYIILQHQSQPICFTTSYSSKTLQLHDAL